MDDWETLSVEQRQAIDAPDPAGAWGDWIAKAQMGQDEVRIKNGFGSTTARIVRARGYHYLAKPRARKGTPFLGFGGREWKIRFLDGTVIETNNLWCQGDIPLHLRTVLPDNAEFIGESSGFEGAPRARLASSAMEATMQQLSRFKHNYRKVMKFIEERKISDDEYASETEERRPEVDIEDAHVIGSRIIEGPHAGLHTIIIDVDHPTYAPNSSSLGHHHLYIDKPMPWEDVVKVLRTLAEVGIVEEGYAAASIERGETNVRLPWVMKFHDHEEIAYFTDDKGNRTRMGTDGEAPF